MLGTLVYSAPESIPSSVLDTEKQQLTTKMDVFSCTSNQLEQCGQLDTQVIQKKRAYCPNKQKLYLKLETFLIANL